MAKVLLINGSLGNNESSVSTRVANVFIEAYKKINTDDEIIQVNVNDAPNIRLTASILQGQLTESDYEVIENRGKILELVKAADKIVLSSPMWNYGLPGQVKEYIDTFAVAKETFAYLPEPDENGAIVQGLLKDKKVLFIQAMGGFNYGPNDVAFRQVKALFNLIGITDISYTAIQATNIPNHSEEAVKTQEVLETVKNF